MFSQSFDQGLKALAIRLQTQGAKTITDLNRGVATVAIRGAQRAKVLTPRSPGGANHVGDGWVATIKPNSKGGIDAVIENRNPRANASVPLKRGGDTTLIHMLEFGTRPHVISAKAGKLLVFFWPKVGRTVRAKQVFHPGTRPYSMLAITRVQVQVELKAVLDDVATKFRRGA